MPRPMIGIMKAAYTVSQHRREERPVGAVIIEMTIAGGLNSGSRMPPFRTVK
jgi:hypothetical protein